MSFFRALFSVNDQWLAGARPAGPLSVSARMAFLDQAAFVNQTSIGE